MKEKRVEVRGSKIPGMRPELWSSMITFSEGDEPRMNGWSFFYLVTQDRGYMQDYDACMKYQKTIFPNTETK